jgi:hypothetical protein
MILDASKQTPAGDVNTDESYDVSDITTLVNIILGTNNAPKRVAAASEAALSTASIEPNGNKESLLINIANPEYAFTAIQFNVCFEGGIEVKTSCTGKYSISRGDRFESYYDEDADETTYSHTIESALQNDGSVLVAIYSGANTVFTGTEGNVAKLNITAAGVADGEYKVELKNVIISAPDGSKQTLADYTGWITVTGGTAGIDDIIADGAANNEAIYDLSGRKVENPTKGIYIVDGKKVIY